MGLPFEDDDDRRAQLEELGEQFVVDDATVYGVLRQDEAPLDIDSGHSVSGALLTLTLVDADVPDLAIGSEVMRVADSVQWVVEHPPQRDGTGVVRVLLNIR